MIQTAHIGVGIEGNEGNQAAYFADYSIPNFYGLKRLVFWHGLPFGKKSFEIMFPLNIYKGAIFMSVTLCLNTLNGFSGLSFIDFFYYALFGVINTTMLPIIMYIASTHVNYDYSSYGAEV
jgi:magnesium-transporting ATPase (P-type)